MAQLHSSRTANHRPYAAVYADSTERLAATGFERALGGGIVPFATEDLYKTALQIDTATEWLLTAITPTWVQVGGAGVPPADHAAQHENGGGDEISVAGLSGVLADPQVPGGSAGGDLAGTYPNPTVKTNLKTKDIVFIFDGGGSVITTGIHGDLGPIDFAGTIQSVTLLADQSGDIVIDVWKDTYANFPATDADSITASAPPTISAAVKSQDATLTGWTTAIAAGDILRFNVDSVATLTRVTLTLKVLAT